MVSAISWWIKPFDITDVAIELPQVYREAKLKGDPNDLIDLAAVVGAICCNSLPGRKNVYLPREWKGQTPKAIFIERAKKRLSLEELQAVRLPKAKILAHNVWDSVALGLVHLGRM